jgi:hypothetical protein
VDTTVIKIFILGLLFFSCQDEKPNETAINIDTATVATNSPIPIKDSTKTDKQDSIEIIAQTFRFLVGHNASGVLVKYLDCYFITLNDSITNISTDAIVKALTDISPKVKNKKELKALTEKQKDKLHFIIFHISGFSTTDLNRTSTVRCGYWVGGLNASTNEVTLTKEKGVWTVKKNEMISIS